MGKHRVKCPVCGGYAYQSSIDKFYELEIFENVGMGRARGVKLLSVVDLPFIERVKLKIKDLYHKFFSEEEKIVDVDDVTSITEIFVGVPAAVLRRAVLPPLERHMRVKKVTKRVTKIKPKGGRWKIEKN